MTWSACPPPPASCRVGGSETRRSARAVRWARAAPTRSSRAGHGHRGTAAPPGYIGVQPGAQACSLEHMGWSLEHTGLQPGSRGAAACLHPLERLGVVRRDAVPDAPHVLPRDVAHPVEPGVVQRVCALHVPPAADARHAARLQPLEEVDLRGSRSRSIELSRPAAALPPAQSAPPQAVQLAAQLGLGPRGVAAWATWGCSWVT